MKPNLKLEINIQADVDNCIYNVKNQSKVVPDFLDKFLPLNLQHLLGGEPSSIKRTRIIQEYTEHIYSANADSIEGDVGDTKECWEKVEDKFYKLVNGVFQDYSWPDGEYVGTASIFRMYPRNIKNKTFYFPAQKTRLGSLGIIAHEMLHFIFFDFIKNKYGLGEKSKIKGKSPEYVWQVSETFNNVIENWEPYKEIFSEEPRPYAGCKKMLEVMEQQWKEKQDINFFLDQWFL